MYWKRCLGVDGLGLKNSALRARVQCRTKARAESICPDWALLSPSSRMRISSGHCDLLAAKLVSRRAARAKQANVDKLSKQLAQANTQLSTIQHSHSAKVAELFLLDKQCRECSAGTGNAAKGSSRDSTE